MGTLIKKPTTSPTISFEVEGAIDPISVSVTALNHLYGEAIVSARALEGLPATDQPRSITIYDCFRKAICEHFQIDLKSLDPDTVFLIAGEMEAAIVDLKKTCITTAV